jgi:hypothetical protein
MKTWRINRTIRVAWEDDVEVDAETEESAREIAHHIEASVLDADPDGFQDIEIDNVELIADDDPDAEPIPYVAPKNQIVLTGFEEMRPDYPRAPH